MSSTKWVGEVEIRKIFVETESKSADKPKRMPIKLRSIILRNAEYGSELVFTVTKTKWGWSIRDPRGEACTTKTVWVPGKGPTRVVIGCDKGKSLTPSGFVDTVKNMIDEATAHGLLVEACYGGKPSTDA